MPNTFNYEFPAIRGVQAGREYYVSLCPLRLIPKIFLFDESELKPEVRAQRTLNRGRIPALTRYILDSPDGYCFSALTASIDAEVTFEPVGEGGTGERLGCLRVPMEARFIINDGQHRRAAIEAALREHPHLGDETIAVVFFLDVGLKRCQQMFADLNRHAVRPSRSLGILYDHRDDRAQLAKLVVLRSPVFQDVVELERSTLSPRSRKLFTLSSIYTATSTLLSGLENGSVESDATLASEFWEEIAKHFPEWQAVRDLKMTAAEVRRDYLHSHGIVLHALGRVGNALLKGKPPAWKRPLATLRKIDWRRSNAKLWEGRAMSAGRVSKAGEHVTLTTNLIKAQIGIPLTPDEHRVENAFLRGGNAN